MSTSPVPSIKTQFRTIDRLQIRVAETENHDPQTPTLLLTSP
jgi:hypothetical protein